MSRKRKTKRVAGSVVAIPLSDSDQVGFGLVLEEPLMAFFDVSAKAGHEPSLREIASYPVAFRIWVMNQPVVDGLWPVLGKMDVPEELAVAPWFFKQDPISGKITIGKTGSEERSPEPGQLVGLERAAVWSAVHVVDRLRDHLANRPNKWVESMRLKT
jgi:Immunity protein 26